MTKDEALAPTSIQCEVQDELCSSQEPCGGCGGSGWFPRDPDIGTEQECFDCNGSGVQPEQEPVAKVVSTAPDRIWLDLGFDPQDEYEIIFHELHDVTWSQDNASGNGIEYVRADTTPPKRQPLTKSQIIKIVIAHTHDANGHDDIWVDGEAVARATEAAHDIKEQQ